MAATDNSFFLIGRLKEIFSEAAWLNELKLGSNHH
jgi:hypothetical protein